MNKLSRIWAVALIVAMLLGTLPAWAEEDLSPYHRTLNIYFFDSTEVSTFDVTFFTEAQDIPYISVRSVSKLLSLMAEEMGDPGFSIVDEGLTTYSDLSSYGMLQAGSDMDEETSVYVIERENGSFVVFDAVYNMICISDMDLFQANSFALSGGDLVSTDGIQTVNGESFVNLYKRASNRQFVRVGDLTPIDLDDYDIGIKTVDGVMYIPLATVSDLLLQTPVTFNGVDLFVPGGDLDNITVNENDETLYDLYYKPGERTRSEDLACFAYNELCLMLDQCYGLAEAHGVKNGFADYFIANGLADKLMSTDKNVYAEALNQLMDGYFGDLHSSYTATSPYSGGSVQISGSNLSVSLAESNARDTRFRNAREAAGITVDLQLLDGYTEVGDTAFITFDSFKGARQDYYDPFVQENLSDTYMSDTVGLVIWAQNRIHREDSPIRRVVIDLSCNGGGSYDAAVYISAWILGVSTVNIENSGTGAQYSTSYWVDTNLDGQCLDDDDLGIDQLDVYCLISGNSFSCGNLLPAIFKQDGRVTLVGQASGGGACVVRNTSTADGALLRISDFRKLCIVKNGSFYDIDQGVEPDIALRKAESYYDRAALMEYLDGFR